MAKKGYRYQWHKIEYCKSTPFPAPVQVLYPIDIHYSRVNNIIIIAHDTISFTAKKQKNKTKHNKWIDKNNQHHVTQHEPKKTQRPTNRLLTFMPWMPMTFTSSDTKFSRA